MPGDLGLLTWDASTAISLHLGGHARPDIAETEARVALPPAWERAWNFARTSAARDAGKIGLGVSREASQRMGRPEGKVHCMGASNAYDNGMYSLQHRTTEIKTPKI